MFHLELPPSPLAGCGQEPEDAALGAQRKEILMKMALSKDQLRTGAHDHVAGRSMSLAACEATSNITTSNSDMRSLVLLMEWS